MYEALTRQKAFGGETSSDSIAAILEREPDLAILGDAVPDNIERLLSRCLQKDQHRRLQDIADARVEIESAITALKTGAHKKPARHGATGWRWGVPWILAALLVAVIAGLSLWILRLFRSTAPPAIVRMAITLAPSEQLSDLTFPAAALSPDGKRLVYVGSRGPRTQLYLRMMDRLDATAIPGTEGGNRPFFSPDGRWLGFFSGGKLKKVTTSGGAPITLCEAVSPRGASWGPGNTIILAPMAGSGLWKVSAEGGSPQAVTTLDATKGEASHRWPDFLPDGKTVIFTIWSGGGWDDAQVAVQNLETGSRTILVRGGTYARYSPTGHMIYARGGVLHAAQFDLARMRLLGFAAPIVEGIMESTSTGVAQFSFSSNGTLVYVPGGLQVVARSLVWVDRSGKVELLTTTPRAYAQPRLSPDGLRIACQVEGATSDLWLFDVPRSTMTRLTSEGHNTWPIWTPAGNRITFASARAGPLNLYWIPSDGSGTAEKLTTSEHPHVPGSWSPDGRELAFVQVNPKTGWDIRVLSLAERQKPRDFLASPFSEDSPVFSPDGHWLAYVSNESGESEIYARPYPGPGSKWPISSGGGTEPVWAKNGRELFFRNGDKIMSAEIIMHPKFSSGKPKVILQGNYERSPVSRANYDVSPDGRRFIMIKESGREAAPTQLNIVFNWFEELKSRARSPRP
jgi:serine/threonine-protein kinase